MFIVLCGFVFRFVYSKLPYERVAFQDLVKQTRWLICLKKKPPMGYLLALWTHSHLPLDATHLLNIRSQWVLDTSKHIASEPEKHTLHQSV